MPKDQSNGKSGKKNSGLSRRTFLKSVGLSSVGAAAVKGEGLVGKPERKGILPAENLVGPDSIKLSLMVNGKKHSVTIESRMTLAEVLREHLDLTGTKIGCDRGSCGACTVILDGKAVCSCMTLAVDASGLAIETVEGLQKDNLHALQVSFIENDALQCGFCTSGMLMSSKNLLDTTAKPKPEEIKEAVSGNLCRCGTYPLVFKAVQDVVDNK